MDALFYQHTLLPELFKAKQSGINIRNKSSLLQYFAGAEYEPEHLWVCAASGEDLSHTADIVDRMVTQKSNVLASLLSDVPLAAIKTAVASVDNPVSEGVRELLAASSEVDRLNAMLWKSDLKVLSPKIASEKDVIDLAGRASAYLKSTGAKEQFVQEAVLDFVDQIYLSDADFKHDLEPRKIFAAKHLYYKNTGDDLDDTEIDSEVTDEQIELAKREIKKYLL